MLKKVTEGIFVHQSELLQNNTIIVQGKNGVLVVDPGITFDEMNSLVADLREMGQSVVAGFSTHPHWDHVLWHTELGNVPRYGTARNAALMQDLLSKKDWEEQVAEGLPPQYAGKVPMELLGLITALPADTKYLPWEGSNIRVIEHSAHEEGHAALFIEEAGVLVVGDMLSDVFVPMLNLQAMDPTSDYLVALQLFKDIAHNVEFVIPGHGSVAEGAQVRARIELDYAYVQALRDDVNVEDPRVGALAKKGWEWVTGIHEWQAAQISEKNKLRK